MEAVVSHIRMDVAGGAEYMTALVVNLLQRMRYNVTLVTGTPFDRNRFSELSGIYIDDNVRIRTVNSALDKILTPTKKRGNALLTIYRSRLLKEVVTNVRPRIVLTDDEVFEAIRDMKSYYGHLIHYVHFPYDNILNLYDLDSVRQRYEFPYKVALELYALWAKKHIILQNFSDMVIANSKYTRSHCVKIWGRDDVRVLYPSIKVSAFSNSANKDKTCIVIGRIAPDKNIGHALQAFRSPKLQDYKLIIAGQIIDQYERYAQTVINESKNSPNIQVVPNPSKDRLKELLAGAKVLLHPRQGEHFGLAIVEGMASGCIPVVHRSGGPLEIIDGGKYGFTFTKDDMVDTLLQAFQAPPSMRAACVERARQFDTSVFEEGFTKIVSSIA